VIPAAPLPKRFVCSICREPSGELCVWCTKDVCDNHVCPKCKRCSDCCECEQVRERKITES
jgi:hypothetical protein